jgi:hypothetical protein
LSWLFAVTNQRETKMKKFLSMFAVAFVLLFAGFVTEASAICYTNGDVKDIENGAAVSGVTVNMLDQSTAIVVDSTTTDANGHYQFSYSGTGSFNIYVSDTTSGFTYYEYTPTTSPYYGGQVVTRTCGSSTSTQTIDFLRIRPNGTVAGQINNNSNPPAPLANRRVVFYLYDINGGFVGSTDAYTDSSGNYSKTIGCGFKYTIFVESSGTEVVTAVNSSSGGGTFTQVGCIQASYSIYDFTIAP